MYNIQIVLFQYINNNRSVNRYVNISDSGYTNAVETLNTSLCAEMMDPNRQRQARFGILEDEGIGAWGQVQDHSPGLSPG